MKKLIIFGGNGFIGKYVSSFFINNNNFEIHIITRSLKNISSNLKSPRIIFHALDLFNQDEIKILFRKIKPTHLIQLAWCSEHQKYWNDPQNNIWVEINNTISRSFINNGGNRAIFIGSSAEYDWSTNNLLNEFESKLNPFSIYGKSKLKSFYETTNYFEKNFASMSWIRLFNPFGPGEDERRLIPKLCINLFKDQKMEFDAANTTRDFIYVNDLAYLIYELLNSDYFGPINISSGEKTIIKDLIIKAAKYFNKEKLINFDSSIDEPKFPFVVADTSLIKKVLKIKYPEKINSRLHETFEYWQERLSSIS